MGNDMLYIWYLLAFLFTQSLLVSAKEYTLADLRIMADEYQEMVKSDNNNDFNPDFSNHLMKMRPGYGTLFLRMFGLKKDPFPFYDFEEILQSVISNQKARGRSGKFIIGTRLSAATKIIVFGNIQAAFHSLIRDLEELFSQGIIDEHLKIMQPHCYIIFNGTAVGRSPYVLQTLFTLLLLMQKNPDQVFYMGSDFELNQLWKNGSLARQLNILYRKHEERTYALFSNLIDTLPAAFYGNFESHPEKLLKITGLLNFKHDSIENETGDFFYQLKRDQVKTWDLKRKEKNTKSVYTAVLLEDFDPNVKMSSITSLVYEDPIDIAAVWRVFSAATDTFYHIYKFKDDTFAKILCGDDLNSSFIDLYTHNRLGKEKFKLEARYKLDSGVEKPIIQPLNNQSVEKIYLGSTLDLSKSNFSMGDRVRTGIMMAINQLNRSGKLKDKEVNMCILDDGYTPRIAHKNIMHLEKDLNIHTLLLPIGTPTVLTVEDQIQAGQIFAAFPITGSAELRDSDCKGVINFRPEYALEVEKLIEYLVNEYHFKTFAFFYQDDAYGRDCHKKAQEVLAKHGIITSIGLPYTRNTTDFLKQCQKLQDAQVEALGCFSTSQPTQEFLRQVSAANLVGTKVFAVSFAVDDVLEAFITYELGLKCIFSRTVPDPTKSDLPLVQEYRLLMDQLKKPYDVYSLEAYICTSILCEALKQMDGPINHTTIIKQLEQFKDYNFKGLTLSFNPQNRQISQHLWFDFQDGGDWLKVL